MKPYLLFCLHTMLLLFTVHCFSQTPVLKLLWQKTAQVQTIEFPPGNTSIVTGGATGNCYPYQCGQIKVWKTLDGALLRTITAQDMGLTNDIDISNDGNNIISGNGTAYCYPNGGCVADKPGQFKFTFNGTLKKSLTNPGGNIYAIRYAPDEAVIAAGTGYNNTGEIRIYNKRFTLIRTLPAHQNETGSLVFTPDNKYLVAGSDSEFVGLVKIWDFKTGVLVREMVHGDYLNGGSSAQVDVSPDGKYIASAGQGYNMTTKIWRVSDGALIRTLHIDGSDGYNTVKFTPDGKFVVSGVIQYNSGWFGRILFWNISTGALAKNYIDKEGSPQSGGIRTIEFSQSSGDSYYLAYSVAGKLKLFSVSTTAGAASNALAQVNNAGVVSATSAFPNPFASATNIHFNLTSKQFIVLAVYDVTGRKIATLLEGEKDAGSYSVTFNAGKISTGVYFYKLQAGTHSEVKKLYYSR